MGGYYFWSHTGLNIRTSFDHCDFFLEYGNNYFANYVDNTKIRIVDENTKEILTNLSAWAKSSIHKTKANHEKGHLILSTQSSTCMQLEYIIIIHYNKIV